MPIEFSREVSFSTFQAKLSCHVLSFVFCHVLFSGFRLISCHVFSFSHHWVHSSPLSLFHSCTPSPITSPQYLASRFSSVHREILTLTDILPNLTSRLAMSSMIQQVLPGQVFASCFPQSQLLLFFLSLRFHVIRLSRAFCFLC